MQKLHAVHTGFHSDLVRACTAPRDGALTGNVTIADCFISWKEKLLVYGEFCSNLPRAQKLLDRLCEAKPVIGERVTVGLHSVLLCDVKLLTFEFVHVFIR